MLNSFWRKILQIFGDLAIIGSASYVLILIGGRKSVSVDGGLTALRVRIAETVLSIADF